MYLYAENDTLTTKQGNCWKVRAGGVEDSPIQLHDARTIQDCSAFVQIYVNVSGRPPVAGASSAVDEKSEESELCEKSELCEQSA